MNENIKIVPISDKYYDQALQIYKDAFANKFRFATQDESLYMSFPHDLGLVDTAADDSIFIAVDKDTVLGIVILTFQGSKNKGFNLRLTNDEMFKKYGFKSVMRVSMLGMMFDHKCKADEMYIDSISVSKSARGRGLGTLLIDYAKDYANSKGLTKLSLSVMNENPRAKALYEKLGFKVTKRISRRMIRRSTGYTGGYFMVLDL